MSQAIFRSEDGHLVVRDMDENQREPDRVKLRATSPDISSVMAQMPTLLDPDAGDKTASIYRHDPQAPIVWTITIKRTVTR